MKIYTKQKKYNAKSKGKIGWMRKHIAKNPGCKADYESWLDAFQIELDTNFPNEKRK